MRPQRSRKLRQPNFERIERLYKALCSINRSIVHVRPRESLFREICSILVETGGFKLAWIGQFDPVTLRVLPVAMVGAPGVRLERVAIHADEKPERPGPVGAALRTGQPYIGTADVGDHKTSSGRTGATKRDFRAFGIFPIAHKESIFGILGVYASSVGFFKQREVELIEEAVEDLSCAFNIIDQRDMAERSDTEIALNRAQAELETVVAHLDEGLLIASRDGAILKCNPAALRLSGVADDQLPPERLSDFGGLIELFTLDGVRLEAGEWPTARIRRGETLKNYEVMLRRLGSETTRILSYSGSLVGRGWDDHALLFVTFQEISDRKAAEKTIRHLASFPEYDPDLVFELGPQLNVDYVNPAMQAAMEKAGIRNPIVFLPDAWKARLLQRAPIFEETDTFDFEIGERSYLGRIRYLPQFQSLRIYGTDITNFLSVQTALRSAQAEIEVVVENLNEGLIISDLNGDFLRRNPAAFSIAGITDRAKDMRNCAQLEQILEISTMDGMVLEVDEWPLQRVLRGETLSNFEARVRRRDSRDEKILNYNGSIVKYDLQKEIAFLKFQDITERKRAEESLREAQSQLFQAQKMEAIGQLAGGIAHDFNNALSVILGYGEMLEERLVSDETSLRFVRQMLFAEQRAAALTRQLLMFSRKQFSNPTNLNLNEVVDGILEMIQRIVGVNAIVKVERDQELACVFADRVQVEQVLLNLCLNARDAMPDGGTMTIRTANAEIAAADQSCFPHGKVGSFATVSISDTGCGMDAATLKRAFEPFFTTKETGRGTGLGLSTSYGIVEHSGGHICAESELGKGSMFTIYLPALNELVISSSQYNSLSSTTEGSEVVLVVDDEDQLRKILCTTLSSKGYRVLEAADAHSALAILENRTIPVDLLVTDVIMPGLSGAELARRLHRAGQIRRAVFISGYADDFLNPDLDDFPNAIVLQKPMSADGFLKSVRMVLDK